MARLRWQRGERILPTTGSERSKYGISVFSSDRQAGILVIGRSMKERAEDLPRSTCTAITRQARKDSVYVGREANALWRNDGYGASAHR